MSRQKIALSAYRAASKALRDASKKQGHSWQWAVAETRGLSDAVRGAFAARTPIPEIHQGLHTVGRVASGGRMPPIGSKPDRFLEDAQANADFIGQNMWMRKGGYKGENTLSGPFHIPKLPQGSIKNDVAKIRRGRK